MADPRYEQLTAEDWVPLPLAHNVVKKGKSTIYRWAQNNELTITETDAGPMVNVGSLQETYASKRRGRKRRVGSPHDE